MHLFSQKQRPSAPPGDVVDFARDVLSASTTQVVIADFCAPWCGPCKQLSPILAKATNRKGVTLVKINIDANPAIAAQLGVQSVPAVFAFFKGKPVDGFLGAQPEGQINAFIERVLKQVGLPEDNEPSPDLLAHAAQALESKDIAGALELYSGILSVQPQSLPATAGVARCYLASGDSTRARGILSALDDSSRKDPSIQSVLAAIDLVERGQALANSRAERETQLHANPDDHSARHDLALIDFANGQPETAINHLLEIIRRERGWNEDSGRKRVLEIFDALGASHPLTVQGRRQLSTLLFS